MARWKIEVSGKGIRKASIDKLVADIKKQYGDEVNVTVSDNTPPASRADRFSEAVDFAEQAKGIGEELKDELQEWFDNLPQNFQDGDKGQQLQAAIDELETFCDQMDQGASASVDFPGMY